MKRIILLASTLCLVFSLFGQEKTLSEEKRKEFEAQKIAFFTQEMDLSPEEASKFWPLYNEMRAKIREKGGKIRALIKQQLGKESAEKQIHDTIAAILDAEMQIHVIKKAYYSKIEQALSARKLWLLLQAEQNFHRHLWKKLGKCKPAEIK